MTIKMNTIKVIAKSITKKQISDRAMYFLADKMEEQIKEIIKKSEQLLEERNKLRQTQNIPIKERISEEIIKEVLNNEKT